MPTTCWNSVPPKETNMLSMRNLHNCLCKPRNIREASRCSSSYSYPNVSPVISWRKSNVNIKTFNDFLVALSPRNTCPQNWTNMLSIKKCIWIMSPCLYLLLGFEWLLTK
jgi:hypothetical protein